MYSNSTDIIIIGIVMVMLLAWLGFIILCSKSPQRKSLTPQQQEVIDDLNACAIAKGLTPGELTDKELMQVIDDCNYEVFKINPFFVGMKKKEPNHDS